MVIDRMGEGAGWARSCCIHNLPYLLGGQLLDSTPIVQGVVLCLEAFVDAEGTEFVWSIANGSFGLIVMSGRVIQADFFDCNISNGDVIIKVQWIVVIGFCHRGDERGEEVEDGGRYLVSNIGSFKHFQRREEYRTQSRTH